MTTRPLAAGALAGSASGGLAPRGPSQDYLLRGAQPERPNYFLHVEPYTLNVILSNMASDLDLWLENLWHWLAKISSPSL
jgi:hypothetical protein